MADKLILGKMALRDVVSFDLHVSAILPQDFDHVTVIGVFPAELCDKFGVDVYALHAQVYRLVPRGTIQDDPQSYDYLAVKTESGDIRVVGIPWIDKNTIKVYRTNTVSFTVSNIAEEDISRVVDAINRFGYHVSIEKTSVEVN